MRAVIGFMVLFSFLAVTLAAQPLRMGDLTGIQADFQVWGKQASVHNYGLGSAVAVGDWNGDGIDDVAVGNHDQTVNSLNQAGEVYVFFGRANRPRETVDLGIQAADVTIQGLASGAQLGRSLAVGDVNGDGVADLIVGEPFLRRTVSYDAGAVYVFHGRGTWPTVTNSSSADLTVLGGQYGQFGMAVAAGDVNHDGTDDLIVGASEVGVSSTRTRVGQAYAIFTSKTFPARHVIDLAITSPDVTITGRDYADRLGISVASGDPNGDGIADMLVGSPMARPGARANAGEVYVIWGRTTWTPGYHVDLAATTGPQPDLLIEGKNLYDRLSWTMVTGDLNGDGIDDILTGAHRADPPSPRRVEGGIAYVFFGSRSFPANHVINLETATPDVAVYGKAEDDQLGFGCAIGDVDHDGVLDVILSAPRADYPNRDNCGAVYVIRGPFTGPTVRDFALQAADWEIYGPGPEAYLGNGAASLSDEFRSALATGDFNTDAATDIVAGAHRFSPASRAQAGGAFVVLGGFTYWLDPPRVNTTARIQIQAPAYPKHVPAGRGRVRRRGRHCHRHPDVPHQSRRDVLLLADDAGPFPGLCRFHRCPGRGRGPRGHSRCGRPGGIHPVHGVRAARSECALGRGRRGQPHTHHLRALNHTEPRVNPGRWSTPPPPGARGFLWVVASRSFRLLSRVVSVTVCP